MVMYMGVWCCIGVYRGIWYCIGVYGDVYGYMVLYRVYGYV